jgi:3D (Asp-Asp-Asp) domain-containing protein
MRIANRAVKGKKKRSKLFRAARIVFLALLCLFLCSLGSSARYLGYKVIASGEVAATAYNSMESQTDSTPWITASGTRCREGVIASNFLPIGTKVLIEGFGERVFTVEDRMNKRYKKRIDIWFRDYDDAMQFGLRKIRFHVIKTA